MKKDVSFFRFMNPNTSTNKVQENMSTLKLKKLAILSMFIGALFFQSCEKDEMSESDNSL